MELLNQHILDCIEHHNSFAVATILTHKGSTPRTSGSKMVVLKDRTIHGTIGGGLVEAMVIDAGIELIDKNRCMIKEFSLNHELKDGLDMVCGGTLSVLIETFVPDLDMGSDMDSDKDSNIDSNMDSSLANIFKTLVDLEKMGKKGFLISKIKGTTNLDSTNLDFINLDSTNSNFTNSDFTMHKCLLLPDGKIIGKNILPKPLFDSILDNKFHSQAPIIHNQNLEEFIIETILPQNCIYIFGAGHVGFQLARIAHITDFQTIIIDDRKEFANNERFPHARQIHAVKHFSNAFDNLEIDNNSYIVILTRGHLHDQTVLETALKTAPAYIGMIGSKAKRNKIYKNLAKKGVKKNTLAAIHSPIGIEIKAQTPGEIAVSIMGEIINNKESI